MAITTTNSGTAMNATFHGVNQAVKNRNTIKLCHIKSLWLASCRPISSVFYGNSRPKFICKILVKITAI